MSLTCGMVGLIACGKTTIYNAVTAAGAASFDGSEMHKAVVSVPDERLQALAKIYNPSGVVAATMRVVDIPGLKAGATDKPGRSTRLLQAYQGCRCPASCGAVLYVRRPLLARQRYRPGA